MWMSTLDWSKYASMTFPVSPCMQFSLSHHKPSRRNCEKYGSKPSKRGRWLRSPKTCNYSNSYMIPFYI